MDRQEEGRRLLVRIWFKRFEYVNRTGRNPKHLTLGWEDTLRVWVGMTNGVQEFRIMKEVFGMECHLLHELPEGMIVIS